MFIFIFFSLSFKNFGLRIGVFMNIYYEYYKEVNGTNFNENKVLDIYLERHHYRKKGRTYITFFDKETYTRIRPQITNKTIPRKDIVDFIHQTARNPVCYSGEWIYDQTIHCNLSLTEGGTLFLISIEEGRTVFYFYIPYFYIPSSQHKLNIIILAFYIYFSIIFIIFLIIYMCKRCKELNKLLEKREKKHRAQILHDISKMIS